MGSGDKHVDKFETNDVCLSMVVGLRLYLEGLLGSQVSLHHVVTGFPQVVTEPAHPRGSVCYFVHHRPLGTSSAKYHKSHSSDNGSWMSSI
jgi:hypothetical protein